MKKLQFVFILTLFVATQGLAQSWGWGSGISGEGPVVEKELKVDAFDAIKLSVSGNVYLKQGSTQKVVVKAQQNIIDNLVTDVNDGEWKIKFDKNVRNYKELKFYITIPTLTHAKVSGSGSIVGENTFSGLGDLYVGISGSGSIKMSLNAKSLESKISGSGNIQVEGSATNLSVHISGSGDVDGENLVAENTKIKISGSGDCSVHAKENLEVRISGSGDVYYKGRPRVSSKISGSGDLESRS